MKKDDIKIGGTYLAKVTDRVVPVRIDRENSHGGWDATNLVTNKQVRIKSAQRLRGEASAKGGTVANKAEATTEKATKPSEPATQPATKPTMTSKAKAPKTPKEPKTDKGLSCLDAAVEVLKASKEPLQVKTMIDQMFAKKLWHSDAPTPAATLYSAILREIQVKGKEARFKKTERGHFTLNA